MPINPVTSANPTGLPAGVGRTQEEKAALGFERQLLVTLTEQLAKSAMPEGEGSSSATQAYRDMLPGTLADAMVAAGGVGIAASLVKGTGR
jgi:Rod binding domain-containing protein